ncbi:unnamed protein product [Caenorhabditis sp. 36 PRJEB53466]|nr:unnamed protein product [Caenorhabditis sp. 36 PRJEB53466]
MQMRTFVLFSLFSLCASVLSETTTPKVVEISGDADGILNLLKRVMEASRRENINQHFRVRTVDGNVIMESVDYKPGGALDYLN